MLLSLPIAVLRLPPVVLLLWLPAMLLSLLVLLRDGLQVMGAHTQENSFQRGMEMRGSGDGHTLGGSTAQPRSGSP